MNWLQARDLEDFHEGALSSLRGIRWAFRLEDRCLQRVP